MRRRLLGPLSTAILLLLWPMLAARAQDSDLVPPFIKGQELFVEKCTRCHGNATAAVRAPSMQTLMRLTPEAVYAALTTGPMSIQATDLTDEQKRLIALYLGGRPLGSMDAGDTKKMADRCASNPPFGDPSAIGA